MFNKKINKQKWAFCIHEAGHAVIAHCYGRRVTLITYREYIQYTGMEILICVEGETKFIPEVNPKYIIGDIDILLAGSIAEHLFIKSQKKFVLAKTDLDQLRKLDVKRKEFMDRKIPVMDMIISNKDNIWAVAEELYIKEAISGKQFRKIYK